MLNKLILIAFLFFSSISNSSTYYCPNLPEQITIGDKIEPDWFIWPDNERITKYNVYYYKFFKKTYHFTYWAAFPNGENKGEYKGLKYFISCCGWVKNERKLICAYKSIKEKNCNAKIMGAEKEHFDCENE